ncbi:MAG: hypothetical protein EPN39_02900 [Chitinophagaceae bacterium]|nr:MAG: hypothetical protein EPN39_02900 [Chitinophagaceae bacterium]
MTKKDFFVLLIKLFGLYSIIAAIFSVLPSDIPFALSTINMMSIIWIIFVLVIVIGLFVLLIFKSERIVKLLKLESGFDDDKIELGKFNSAEIIKVGSFIIGGLLIIDNIPVFLNHTFFAFKNSLIGNNYGQDVKFYWALSAIKIILGFLLVTKFAFVANLFQKSKNSNESIMDK